MVKKQAKKSQTAQLAKAMQGVMTMDSFVNYLTRQGVGQPNHMNSTDYPLTRLTQNYGLMNSLYRNNWIIRRIIDTVPKDMTKGWIKYLSEITPEEVDKLNKAERQAKLNKAITKGLRWGRLYGGAAGLMMLDGQEDILEEPLELDSIMPGDFKGLLILDRWSGVYPENELVEDISSPEFGLPKYYLFREMSHGETFKVHHSRIVRFSGLDLPEWETQAEVYWGASVVEPIFEEIKKRDNTSANIAGLIFLANLRVLKMSDLGEILSGTPVKAQEDFYNTIQMQNWLMNNFSMYLMSKEDEFQQFQLTNFSGINDIYESFMLDVSGATGIPATKLFGRAPAGMNATGESDMQNYYDMIEAEQEDNLRPALEKIGPVHCMSTLGYVPDDFDFDFAPIGKPSEKDMGEAVKWRTDAIYGAHDRGLLSDQVGMKELKEMSDTFGMFTNITDEDINNASDEPMGGGLALPGGGNPNIPPEETEEPEENNEGE